MKACHVCAIVIGRMVCVVDREPEEGDEDVPCNNVVGVGGWKLAVVVSRCCTSVHVMLFIAI